MTEFRIHIGAHKTATTHFQDCLFRNVEKLNTYGLAYIPREEFRRLKILSQVRHRFRGGILFNILKHKSLGDLLESNGFYSNKYLISEECILGSSSSLVIGMYKDSRKRLIPWRDLVAPSSLRIFISIRNYKDLLPSAYSQALRDGCYLKSFDSILAYWLQEKPSWFDLIKLVREVFTGSCITIWSFERYIENPLEILNKFSGIELDYQTLIAPCRTKRIGKDDVRKIQLINKYLPKSVRKRIIRNKIITNKNDEIFDPLNECEKNILSARYLEDCQKIKMLDVETIF